MTKNPDTRPFRHSMWINTHNHRSPIIESLKQIHPDLKRISLVYYPENESDITLIFNDREPMSYQEFLSNSPTRNLMFALYSQYYNRAEYMRRWQLFTRSPLGRIYTKTRALKWKIEERTSRRDN